MSEPTVFLVDDDEAVRKMLRWLIESVNLQVEEYASADEFLASYQPNQVGCILLDVRMPGMSGPDLQKQLSQGNSELAVIILTGHGDVPMAVTAMKNGAFDFVEKPLPGTGAWAGKLPSASERKRRCVRARSGRRPY